MYHLLSDPLCVEVVQIEQLFLFHHKILMNTYCVRETNTFDWSTLKYQSQGLRNIIFASMLPFLATLPFPTTKSFPFSFYPKFACYSLVHIFLVRMSVTLNIIFPASLKIVHWAWTFLKDTKRIIFVITYC